MRIIGCDLHARQQSVAMLDTETGEVVNRTLRHEGDEVREFYSQLPRPVLAGIEANPTKQAPEPNRDKFGLPMSPDQRVVTELPLTELWDETGALPGERIRHVDGNLIRGLMGTGQVQFIVADCGAKLNWIPMQERFEFWKAIRLQIADAGRPICLERFPNQTAYIASEWRGRSGECLILLEINH